MLKYREIEVRDTRQCRRCGAVAGRCEHLRAEPGVIVVSEKVLEREIYLPWHPDEEAVVRHLWMAGRSAGQIAEILNRSRASVMSKVRTLGLVGRVEGEAA